MTSVLVTLGVFSGPYLGELLKAPLLRDALTCTDQHTMRDITPVQLAMQRSGACTAITAGTCDVDRDCTRVATMQAAQSLPRASTLLTRQSESE